MESEYILLLLFVVFVLAIKIYALNSSKKLNKIQSYKYHNKLKLDLSIAEKDENFKEAQKIRLNLLWFDNIIRKLSIKSDGSTYTHSDLYLYEHINMEDTRLPKKYNTDNYYHYYFCRKVMGLYGEYSAEKKPNDPYKFCYYKPDDLLPLPIDEIFKAATHISKVFNKDKDGQFMGLGIKFKDEYLPAMLTILGVLYNYIGVSRIDLPTDTKKNKEIGKKYIASLK